MKRIKLTVAFCMLAMSATLFAQDDGQPSQEQIEKAMEAFAKPGQEHKHLQRLVGNWKTETKSYFPNPEKPTASEGTSSFRPLMGGRYVQQNVRGTFDGKRFQGQGLMGYDNSQKKFVGTWIDNFGTGIMTTEGTYDEKTHTMHETGESPSPIGIMKFKMTTKYESDDKFVFTMFMVQGDQTQKMMEMTYTRTAKKPGRGKKSKKKAAAAD